MLSKKMKEIHVIVGLICIGLLVVIFGVYFLYPRSIIEWGSGPEFSIALVDDADNDYIDVKFVSSGTGVHSRSVLYLEKTEIKILSDNDLQLFGSPLSSGPKNLYPGENVRIVTNVDMVKTGSSYRVQLEDFETQEILFFKQVMVES